MRIAITSLLIIILALGLSTPAFAADFYNNGPTNGTSNAFFIDVYRVSDSFTPSENTPLGTFAFVEWVAAGSTPLTVDWSVGTSSFASDIGSGSAIFGMGGDSTVLLCTNGSAFLGGTCGGGFGYDVYESVVTIGSCCFLTGGTTYWLTLTNASDSYGGRDGWDINSGPSMAYHNLLGAVPSESFTLIACGMGNNSPDCGPPPSPEPGSIVLFGTGLLGLAGFLRRKLS